MFKTKSAFERVYEKATSNLLLEPDLDSMLQLCDMIRGGDVKVREATSLIKTRIIDEKNPHVQLFAVSVLDTVMKNCGEAVHSEILTESYMETLKEFVKSSTSENVKNKLLEMIQAWGIGFKDQLKFKVACNLYNVMKAEGYKFPPITDTTDMFKSEKAPTWSDGDECSKCKVEFGLVQRKHHCRACGGIFCNKCTSKQAIIPKYGIEKEVRVCDACYSELIKKDGKSGSSENDLPAEYLNSSLAKQSQDPPKRDEAALKEEEELQLALALSLDEQENKHRIRKEQIANDPVYASVVKPAAAASATPSAPHTVDPDVDPDLARYLNRTFWDNKKQEQEKASPKQNEKGNPAKQESDVAVEETNETVPEPSVAEESLQNDEVPDNSEFLHNLRTSVEIFMNRMRSDEMRGRSIANDSTVQSLFQSINNMHPTLIQFMNDLEEKRLHQEALQDKLVQIRDARAALDALRTEHAEKLRLAAEEADRQRQIQMAQKLEVMRQKKQEYLAYQRQMALQRMQEQEAARVARLEQQKHFIQQRAMQPSMLIAGYNTQYAPAPTEAPVPEQQPGGYYGGYPQMHPQQQQPQQQYLPQSQGMQYPAGQPTTAGYAAPTNFTNSVTYQQQGVMGNQPAGGMQQAQADAYSMQDMNSSLPQQQQMPPGGIPTQQQVVATAPPATPQPSTTSQQMMPGVVDPNTGYQMGQQGYYQQPPPPQDQQQQQVYPQPPTAQQSQELLISFD